MSKCQQCFTDSISKCETALKVYAQLEPGTNYTWVIIDKFGNRYSGNIVTDVDGFFEIPVAELPDGLLTPYSGDFKMQIMDQGCKPVKFKIAQEYDCIVFDVFGGTQSKENIGCDFDCTGTTGASSALLPFSNATNVPIDWSNYSNQLGNNPVIQVYVDAGGGVYNLVTVDIEQVRVNNVLQEINIDLGGLATGYVLLS